jgi:hypothetical protein
LPGHILKAPRKLRHNERKRTRKKRWTWRERALVFARLGRFSTLSGYLVALLLPGGIALLPVLAWWHRHQRPERNAEPKPGRRVRRHRLSVPNPPAARTGSARKPSKSIPPAG